jgi:hypothetical protein
MKRFVAAPIAAIILVALAANAKADPTEYGLKEVSAAMSTSQAGAHPNFVTFFKLKTVGEKGTDLPSTTTRTSLALPPGLLGNPTTVPTCSAAQLVTTDVEDPSNETGCPQASQVGVSEVTVKKEGTILDVTEPVFNMKPRYGEPARFGLVAVNFPVLIDASLRDGPGEDYGATATVEGISSFAPLFAAKTTIWGVPGDESHDGQRITAYEAINGGVPLTPTGKRPSGLVPAPFTLNPTRCGIAQGVNVTTIPYALPDLHSELFAPLAPNTGCGLLDFKPDMKVAPTVTEAETGAGLNVKLSFPTGGFEHPNLFAEASQRKVEFALPAGVTVNPSQAAGGLGVCAQEEFERETASSGPNGGCPEASKVGTVTARSPLLEEPAEGSLFVAEPYQNPFGSLIAIYMVLKVPDRGVVVRLAGKVSTDRQTGQLTSTFEDIPQLPVSSFELHFREGPRAPLVTPGACGVYASTATFTAWSGQVAIIHPSFEINRGVNGGPCPSGGLPPLHPGLVAGTTNNAAGRYSPFNLRLNREDGEQEITRFSVKLPRGVVGKLAGIPLCSDAAIEAAKARTGPRGGQEELEAPSCPAASELGHTLGGAGVGPVLAYAPGKMYLAGPYHGSPLSIAAITAAKVGPFDLGTVVVRDALRIDPETAEVFADGTHSDPLPHLIQGIPVRLREIRAYVDRPEFVLNPTSCNPTATALTVLGTGLDLGSEADDRPVTVSDRFQASGCSALPFRPKLGLRLIGRTSRGAHPKFKAHLKMNGIGEAGIARAQVTLPHSEFIENAHFNTICTRVQFNEGVTPGEKCPAGSIYGRAKAVTPILSEPLKGPVFLRSSQHELPDLVVALHNREVDFDLVGRVDSVKGGGIRNTFETSPDAPVSSFDLEMEGGKKGLFVNSTNLCKGVHRAKADFTGQNGKVFSDTPELRVKCGGKRRKTSSR